MAGGAASTRRPPKVAAALSTEPRHLFTLLVLYAFLIAGTEFRTTAMVFDEQRKAR